MARSHISKKTFAFITIVAPLFSAFAQTPSPYSNAVKVWNFENNNGFRIKGAVQIGIKMDAKDREASTKRGGDGYAAEFNGGWLESEPGINITGKQMTLLIRARNFSNDWNGVLLARKYTGDKYANLLYGSSLDLKQLGFRERERMKTGRSIEYAWETDSLPAQVTTAFLSDDANNPYKLSRDSLGHNKTWTQQLFPQLYQFLRDGILKVSAPVELIGPEKWHDILVRFNGPKLELFIDGVLTDVEYPHGALRQFKSPFLIGAGFKDGIAHSDFRGQIDHLAIWDRALSDGEVATLCGGKEDIAVRRKMIYGQQAAVPQYWRPEGYNEFFGDPVPFFHDSTLHIFFLDDRKHHSLKWGAGAHPWGHISSSDLIHWTTQPKAIDLTRQIENSLGTGNVIFHNGTYYLYYINHGRRLAYSDAPEDFLSDNIYLATSSDGVHFQKNDKPVVRINYQYSGDINPFVWSAPANDHFYMYVSGPPGKENWYFQSDDLRNWTPAKIDALDSVHAACCSYHRWKGAYYWFDWTRGYRQSPIPIEEQGASLKRFVPLTESWAVPQAVPFTGNRMLMVGFTLPVAVYGSMALVRELVKNEDGTIGLKWPAEMIPPSGSPLQLKIYKLKGNFHGNASALQISSADSGTVCFAEKIPDNMRITMRVVPDKGASSFGLCVRGTGDYKSGTVLRFDPHRKTFSYALARNGSDSLLQSEHGVPVSLADVSDLDKPFQLDIIVKDDFIDVCINERYTLFNHRPEDYSKGDRLFFFVRKGTVTFESVSVRPLK